MLVGRIEFRQWRSKGGSYDRTISQMGTMRLQDRYASCYDHVLSGLNGGLFRHDHHKYQAASQGEAYNKVQIVTLVIHSQRITLSLVEYHEPYCDGHRMPPYKLLTHRALSS